MDRAQNAKTQPSSGRQTSSCLTPDSLSHTTPRLRFLALASILARILASSSPSSSASMSTTAASLCPLIYRKAARLYPIVSWFGRRPTCVSGSHTTHVKRDHSLTFCCFKAWRKCPRRERRTLRMARVATIWSWCVLRRKKRIRDVSATLHDCKQHQLRRGFSLSLISNYNPLTFCAQQSS
jgi:hypothetical protein